MSLLLRPNRRKITRVFVIRMETDREELSSANRKLEVSARRQDLFMHQHKCSLCETKWQHGEEWDRDMLAHECPVCGCHQFRLFKVTGGQTTDPSEQTSEKLVQAFASSDPFVRSTTLFSLVFGDQAAQDVLPSLAPLATVDSEVLVRLAAIETLRRFKVDAAWALSALVQALGDHHPEVRRAAVLALGDLGTAAQSASRTLTARLSDTHPRVRTVVAAALAKIQPVTGFWQTSIESW